MIDISFPYIENLQEIEKIELKLRKHILILEKESVHFKVILNEAIAYTDILLKKYHSYKNIFIYEYVLRIRSLLEKMVQSSRLPISSFSTLFYLLERLENEKMGHLSAYDSPAMNVASKRMTEKELYFQSFYDYIRLRQMANHLRKKSKRNIYSVRKPMESALSPRVNSLSRMYSDKQQGMRKETVQTARLLKARRMEKFIELHIKEINVLIPFNNYSVYNFMDIPQKKKKVRRTKQGQQIDYPIVNLFPENILSFSFPLDKEENSDNKKQDKENITVDPRNRNTKNSLSLLGQARNENKGFSFSANPSSNIQLVLIDSGFFHFAIIADCIGRRFIDTQHFIRRNAKRLATKSIWFGSVYFRGQNLYVLEPSVLMQSLVKFS